MSRQPVSIALVGLGDIAMSQHLPALLRSADVRVAAVADPDPDRRAATHRLVPDAALADGLTEVLADPAVAAVVLATPPWVTTDLISEVLAAGRFCLSEKPLAVSSAAAAPLRALPADQEAQLQVGLTYRHDPALGRLREWIVGDVLGAPLLVHADIYDEARSAPGSEHADRILKTLTHGAPAVHEGAHVFDWLAFLLDGPPSAIADAWATATEPGLGAANLGGARLEWGENAQVLVEFGWWTDALPRCELRFLGRRGMAVLDGKASTSPSPRRAAPRRSASPVRAASGASTASWPASSSSSAGTPTAPPRLWPTGSVRSS